MPRSKPAQEAPVPEFEDQDEAPQEVAAAQQADPESDVHKQALQDADDRANGIYGREANPKLGGESFAYGGPPQE